MKNDYSPQGFDGERLQSPGLSERVKNRSVRMFNDKFIRFVDYCSSTCAQTWLLFACNKSTAPIRVFRLTRPECQIEYETRAGGQRNVEPFRGFRIVHSLNNGNNGNRCISNLGLEIERSLLRNKLQRTIQVP